VTDRGRSACPWGPYRETTLVMPRGPESDALRIDLSQTIGPAVRAAIEAIAGSRFAIVTAYNPYFLARGPSTAEENRRAHERLRAELARLRLAHVEADGHANGSREHVERGFAIECDTNTARTLACEFGQDAFFSYEDGVFWIRPAMEPAKPPVRTAG